MKSQCLHDKSICIYCMGEYGIRLCYFLSELGYPIACFGDIDKKKHGYAVEGLFCISYEEVCCLDKNKYIIIVAKKNPEKLMREFKNQGFIEVYSDRELMNLLEKEANQRKKYCKLDDIKEIQSALNELKIIYYQNKEYFQDKGYSNKDYDFRRDMRQMLEDCLLRKKDEYN